MSNHNQRGARRLLVATLLILPFASKPARADYPIASHRYLADPGALVSGGRVYLYNSNDDDNAIDGGYTMKSIVCVSSADLKNWTDHGEVLRVPTDVPWAGFSWAPYVVERNGKFFMYFGNNATGVGVASSTSPTGRFKDAKGSALINASTPGASGTSSWLFDPGVLIDDDGQAYLYFGGNGTNNARVIRLNSDMISVSGSAIAFSPPNFFEASFIHKRNGLYYFSFSTDSSAGLRIDYMTSTSPTSGWTYRGTIGPQPPSNNNNNQASEFEFNGAWYHAYHNRYVATQAGISTTFRRNLGLEQLNYNADGTIQPVTYTTDGVPQLGNLDPYVRVEAETLNAQSGIETEPCSAGGMDVTDLANGDWIKVRGVDFGSAGATSFSASVASTTTGGKIELHLGSPTGTLVGTCAVPNTGGAQTWMMTSCSVSGASGVKDLYLRFTGPSSPLFNLDYWQFSGGDGGDGGARDGGAVAGTGGISGTGGAQGIGGASGTGMGGRPVDAGSAGGASGASGGAGGRDTTAGIGGSRVLGSGGAPAETGGGTAGCSCALARGEHSTITILGLCAVLWLLSRRRRTA